MHRDTDSDDVRRALCDQIARDEALIALYVMHARAYPQDRTSGAQARLIRAHAHHADNQAALAALDAERV